MAFFVFLKPFSHRCCLMVMGLHLAAVMSLIWVEDCPVLTDIQLDHLAQPQDLLRLYCVQPLQKWLTVRERSYADQQSDCIQREKACLPLPSAGHDTVDT